MRLPGRHLAAWDVHHARLLGRCEPTTGIDAFDRLVDQVMTSAPYAWARRVFWIVDNGSPHRGQPSVDRLHVGASLSIVSSWMRRLSASHISVVSQTSRASLRDVGAVGGQGVGRHGDFIAGRRR